MSRLIRGPLSSLQGRLELGRDDEIVTLHL
jgi:hypothetical protein